MESVDASTTQKNVQDSDMRRRGDTPRSSATDCRADDAPASSRQLSVVKHAGWGVVPHNSLPDWLQNNDFLLQGHRPPLPSSTACFLSIFRLHTETVNIWTHFLGALLFLGFAVAFFLGSSPRRFDLEEQIVFLLFFIATILCMSLSWLFHTLSCHSAHVSTLFVKLDYLGIAVLIVGSFVPWLYFGFYCSFMAKLIYLGTIAVLGVVAVVVSSWDAFSLPHFRPVRACLFLAMGLSGVVPATHYLLLEGVVPALTNGCMGWLLLMAAIFVFGTVLYALRIPERYFPGKCDILFQSHQIFHVCVVIACYVQYHGICQLSEYIRSNASCAMP